MRLTLGSELTVIGKDELGRVAYREFCRFHPNICLGLAWDDLPDTQKAPFIATAVSVRGFHPDA
jgi:hypothetical protein